MKKHTAIPSSLADSVQKHVFSRKTPPLHLWNPPFCGDIDIKILRDGQWLYMGTPITRPSLVKLFASVLRREDDDGYYLVTPVEKVRIQVEDAPFLAISVEQKDSALLFTTNTGDLIPLSPEHVLTVKESPVTGNPSPYIHIRDKLVALIHRNVFYQLVQLSEEQQVKGDNYLGVRSFGEFYPLGSIQERQ